MNRIRTRGGVVLLTLLTAGLVALAAPGKAAADEEPVPSLDPVWSAQFVPPPTPRLRAALLCAPVDAVFYAQTDWLRLAQKLRSNPSTCANYYVSIPPLAADKTALRPNQAGPIRALGSNFHAMAEINVTGWTGWVAADPSRTWYDAGLEARRRMAAAGFDVNAGDIWAVNEFSSAVRTGAGNARQNMRDLVRGLYTGDGTTAVPGLIWVSGIGQPTTFLDTYKNNVEAWFGDGPFFEDMSRYVRFFSQENYAYVLNWGVEGSSPQDRLGPLADYLEHIGKLAVHAPSAYAPVAAYLAQANAPLGTAAWPRPAYGWSPKTDPTFPTPYTVAQDFISSQVYAFRHEQAGRPGQAWGFAWNPTNFSLANDGVPPIPDFTPKTAAILDRLAASIHASDAPTDDAGSAACASDLTWCDDNLDGSSSNLAWHTFNTWTRPVADDSSAIVQENTPSDITLNATDDDGDPLTYSIVTQPLDGTLTGSGSTVTYTPANGFFGRDSFTFVVNDGVVDSRIATVSITVNAPPEVTLDPAGPVDEGAAPIALSAHASDPDGDLVTLTWSTPDGTPTFAAEDGPATATVSVTADDGNGGVAKASIAIDVRNVPPTADAGADASGPWGTPVALSGSGTDPSAADRATVAASWDFGDGTTGDGFAARHVYSEPGTYTATLSVRDKDGGTATDTATVTVGRRAAALASVTPPLLDAASSTVAARIDDGTDSGSARLRGHVVTLAVGSSACSGTTNENGLATCTLADPPLGPAAVTATFAADSLYDGASTSAPVLLYARPSGGTFVVGDRSASGTVTFWSPSWWLVNTLSGGSAPASFKGFAHENATGWTASPGLDHAPGSVPEWLGVIVTSAAKKDDSTISGDRRSMVVVHVDTYDPALIGRGTVVADAG